VTISSVDVEGEGNGIAGSGCVPIGLPVRGERFVAGGGVFVTGWDLREAEDRRNPASIGIENQLSEPPHLIRPSDESR